MTRHELYNKITPCGTMGYLDMVYMLNSLVFEPTKEAIRQELLSELTHGGKLSQQNWILLAKSISFLPGSPITADTIEGWLIGKCDLTRQQLKLFLEYAEFNDGSNPTFILAQTGDLIIAE